MGNVFEVGVRGGMECEDLDVLESDRFQHRGHCRETHPVQGRVDDLQFSRAGNALGRDVLDECRVDLVLAVDDLALFDRPGKGDPLDPGDLLHPLDRSRVVRRQKLSTGRPVDLHRVVAGRVVTGGDHDPARAILVTHGKGQLGRASVSVEEIDGEARRRHDLGTQLGEMPRAMPRVVRNGARQRLARSLLLDVVGQPLGTLADRAVVDGVGADRIHATSPAAGPEGDDRPEGVVQLLPHAGGQMLGDLRGVFLQMGFGQPGSDVLDGLGGNLPLGCGGVELRQGRLCINHVLGRDVFASRCGRHDVNPLF